MSLEFLLKVSFGLWKFSWPSRSAYRSIDQFNWSRYKAGVVFPHQFPTKCIRVTVVRISSGISRLQKTYVISAKWSKKNILCNIKMTSFILNNFILFSSVIIFIIAHRGVEETVAASLDWINQLIRLIYANTRNILFEIFRV